MNKSQNVDSHFDNLKRVEFHNARGLNKSNTIGMTYDLHDKNNKLLPSLVNAIKPIVMPYKVNLPCTSYTFPSIISINQTRRFSRVERKGWPPDFYYNDEYANGDIFKVYIPKRFRSFIIDFKLTFL